jgi:TDG/mug DNA glycosylase family protein
LPDHRAIEEWMGQEVETLADLLRPNLRAVCVGINPAPLSVERGHYYQGQLGQRLWDRLRQVGLLPGSSRGWEDDAAFQNGVGFTDIVKRPTRSAQEIRAQEFAYGRPLLVAKLEAAAPGLVIFTFKKTATKYFGNFAGNGFVPGLEVAGRPVFVMPGPMENAATASDTLDELASRMR